MNETSKWKGLIDAARHNDEQAVRLFIEGKGVPSTVTNSRGQTVAHIAVLNENLPMLEYILSVDPSLLKIQDRDHNNVLFLAIEQGALMIVQFLVESHQADIQQINRFRFGANAVHIAAKSANLDILRYFLEGIGADVNVKNYLHETPVFYAAEGQRLENVQYLVEAWNADVTCTDWNGANILYVSAKTGDLSVPQYLMDGRGVVYDVNGRDKVGDTVVNRATRFEHLEFIRYFVKRKGADVNIPDNFQRTPLYFAATLNNYEIVDFLLKSGADIRIGDLLGKTADKLSTADAVIKLLKKTMDDVLAKEKEATKSEKAMERQKITEEKESEAQKVKAQKAAEKQRAREEKAILKENNNKAKNTTSSRKAALKKSKNATTSEPRMSRPSNDSEMTQSEEHATTNSPFQSVTVSNVSEGLGNRSRRNAIESFSVRQSSVSQLTDRMLSSQNTPSVYLNNSWHINGFLIIVDLCFKLLKYPRTKRSRSSGSSRADVKSRRVNSFAMKSIYDYGETSF